MDCSTPGSRQSQLYRRRDGLLREKGQDTFQNRFDKLADVDVGTEVEE